MSHSPAPFLLLHGGWGGAWTWSSVLPTLVAAGHPAVAVDLPGGGLRAVEPASFQRRDRTAMADEPSPVADITADQVAQPAVDLLNELAQRFGPVVVVAHSINGTLLHVLGERHAAQIARLVYVAAVAPAPGRTVAQDTAEPQWSASLFGSLLVADPAAVGALRVDPRSPDPAYRDAMVRCWFADVPPGPRANALRMLATDTPASLLDAAAALTEDGWGSVPRTWIRTVDDASIPIAGQDTNIAQLDAAFPEHPFDVRSIPSGHHVMLSRPDDLAAALLDTAGDVRSARR